jgi:hypothetical protein
MLVIDKDVVDTFTRGQCHALALAIHEQTQLPLAGVWRLFEDPESETPAHVVVLLPDGDLLDIEGPGVECRWSDIYGAAVIVKPLEVEYVHDLHNRDYSKPRMEEAKPRAKAVLKKYGIQPFKMKGGKRK